MPPYLPLEIAIRNIQFARNYTHTLLDDLQDEDWFCMPDGQISHIAWQVGHLAMAQYALTMIRIRGKEPDDAEFISNAFFKTFKKGTKPLPDPTAYPSLEEIKTVFDAVHAQAMAELPDCSEEELNQPLPEPHAAFNTKLGSLYFCANHEMLHAGQIGLIRRMIGKDPVR